MTGNTIHDFAGSLLGNPLGWPALDGHNMAATNESLMRMLEGTFSYTLNPDELIRAVFDVYPEMNTEDNYTRTLAATQMGTDQLFASGASWEANARSWLRYIFYITFFYFPPCMV